LEPVIVTSLHSATLLALKSNLNVKQDKNPVVMTYTKRNVNESDKESLVQIVIDLQSKLKKKNAELHLVRTKLNVSRTKMQKMEETVRFQRQRIIDLYPVGLQTNNNQMIS
jgi:hypothetical protein